MRDELKLENFISRKIKLVFPAQTMVLFWN